MVIEIVELCPGQNLYTQSRDWLTLKFCIVEPPVVKILFLLSLIFLSDLGTWALYKFKDPGIHLTGFCYKIILSMLSDERVLWLKTGSILYRTFYWTGEGGKI